MADEVIDIDLEGDVILLCDTDDEDTMSVYHPCAVSSYAY